MDPLFSGAIGLNYNGSLPDMSWPVVMYDFQYIFLIFMYCSHFEFSTRSRNLASTGLRCPLPQSLINFLNAGKDLEYWFVVIYIFLTNFLHSLSFHPVVFGEL